MTAPLVGTLLFAVLLVLFVMQAKRNRDVRRVQAIRAAAGRIYHMRKTLFSDRHDIHLTRPEYYSELDFAFYDESQKRLEDLGFVFLGNLEDQTLNDYHELRALPTFLRVLTRPDEAITAAIYHTKQVNIIISKGRGEPIWHESRVVDFGTTLSDGTEADTSNAALAALTDEIPGRSRRILPSGAAIDDVLTAHRDHVASVLAEKPGVSPVPIRTIEDYIEEMHKGQDRRKAYYESVGWITRDGFLRIAKHNGTDDKTIEAVWHEIDLLRNGDQLKQGE